MSNQFLFLMNTSNPKVETFSPKLSFDDFPGTVLEFDSELICVRHNKPDGQNFTCLRADFLVGRSLHDLLINPKKKSRILDSFKQVQESLTPCGFYSEPNPETMTPATYTILMKVDHGDGENSTILSLSTEVPVEKAFQDHYKRLFKNIKDYITVLDKHGKILYMNRSFLGLSVNDALETSMFDYFEGDESLVLRASLLRVVEDGTSLTFENYISATNTPKWFSNSISPLVIESDDVAAIVISREISGIKNRIWELGESNKLHDAVVDNIGDAVISVSHSGRIILQNSAARDMFESDLYNLDELEETWSRFSITGKDEAMVQELEFRKALNGEIFKDRSCLLKREDGSVIHVDYSLRPLRGEVNEIIGALLVLKDTTHSHFAREQLITANQNLDSFVHATAHDLKSPIHNMKNLFSLMDRLDSEDKKAELLDKVRQSVDKLDDFLGALMEMVDSRNVDESSVESLRFDNAFSSVCQNLSEEIDKSEVIFKVDFSGAENITYIKAHILSIFQNIISNALKYRKESVRLEIEVSTKNIGDSVELVVKDNGVGIDLERHGEEIFKPFKRVNTRLPGKGIGLNLVKNFVERNGGSIEVVSAKGGGTTFIITLKSY